MGTRIFADCTNVEQVKVNNLCEIPSYTFSDCTALTEIDFGNVPSIAEYAFYHCTALEDLYIPDSVKELKTGSRDSVSPFCGCTGIKTISVGGVETLARGMLYTGSGKLETLTVRGTVKNIGTGAFYSNNDTRYMLYYFETPAELVLEEGIETIGDYAFFGTSFKSMVLPKTVKSIGKSAFAGCRSLQYALYPSTEENWSSVSVGYGNKPLLNVLFFCNAPDFVLPAALTTIEAEAFQNSVTTWVVLPDTIESIGRLAFADCGKLSRVDIPVASVEIDPEAFANSPRVTIFAPAGGTVQSFAEEHGIRFVAVENSVSPAA